MSDRQQQIQILYEISLAIEPRETLVETATTALSAYLQKLNCSVGGVYQATDDGYELLARRPASGERDELFVAGVQRLHQWADADQSGQNRFPIRGSVEQTGEYYLFELPGFGILLLAQRGEGLDRSIISSLSPLNEKLATSCKTIDSQNKLREERNRFQAVFSAIQEPVANITVTDDGTIIHRTNESFANTFGSPVERQVDRFEPIKTAGEDGNLADKLTSGEPIIKEVRRETLHGTGDFLLRAVPVSAEDDNEYFLIYIDITSEKNRQRELQSFYQEVTTLFECEDRSSVCNQTVKTAAKVIDQAVAEIHLYDRAANDLIPAATSEDTIIFDSNSTTLWETYTGDRIQSIEKKVADQTRDINSGMAVPIKGHGVLVIGREESDLSSETDRQFIELLATLSTVAHNRARQTDSLEKIQELTETAVTSEDREDMVDPILRRLPEALDFPLTGIWEYNPAREQLDPLGQTDTAERIIGTPPSFEKGEGIAWKTFKKGKTRVVGDVNSHPEVYNESSPINSEVIAPLGDFGLLVAGSVRSQEFSAIDHSIIATLSSSLETAIQLVDNRNEINLLDQVIGRVLRHNIRNDLNVIKGYAQAIRDDADETSQFVSHIIAKCESLERTANTARTMRDVVETRNDTQIIDLETAVNDAVERLHNRSPQTEIRLDLSMTGNVVAHPKLPDAIYHMLSNSLEHAINDPQTGADYIQIRTTTADDGILLEISDNGPGIPQGELDVLTKHGETALEHGSGVGLWLIDRITQYSDATIDFDTESGTTIQLCLQSTGASSSM